MKRLARLECEWSLLMKQQRYALSNWCQYWLSAWRQCRWLRLALRGSTTGAQRERCMTVTDGLTGHDSKRQLWLRNQNHGTARHAVTCWPPKQAYLARDCQLGGRKYRRSKQTVTWPAAWLLTRSRATCASSPIVTSRPIALSPLSGIGNSTRMKTN